MHGRSTIIWIVALLFVMIISMLSPSTALVPEGPNITIIQNESATVTAATTINTSGGSITTINLSGTTQTPRWKAYVGNVTGKLSLRDASQNTIFDWTVSTPKGEVYATRSPTTVSWADIVCANSTHISNEEAFMNITATNDDSISNTFVSTNHQEFYTGSIQFEEDGCNYTTATYVNGTNQSIDFQEILLYDGTNPSNGEIIYTTLIEDATQGFDFQYYDFQMIVAESGLESSQTNTAYYFYIELS